MQTELNAADRKINKILDSASLEMCHVLNGLGLPDQRALEKRIPKIVRLKLGAFAQEKKQ
jgi:hypothetical protein